MFMRWKGDHYIQETERIEDAAVCYFKELYSNCSTVPRCILPHPQSAQKSVGTEIPYAILKGIPSKKKHPSLSPPANVLRGQEK